MDTRGSVAAPHLLLVCTITLVGIAGFVRYGDASSRSIAGDCADCAPPTGTRTPSVGIAAAATDAFPWTTRGVHPLALRANPGPRDFGVVLLERIAYLIPPISVLVHGGTRTKEFWHGLAQGAWYWIHEVGSGFVDIGRLALDETADEYPFPLNYAVGWGRRIGSAITNPIRTLRFVGTAVGSALGQIRNLAVGCAFGPGSARSVGWQCGQVTMEVASFAAGGRAYHTIVNSRYAGPLRYLGRLEHAIERGTQRAFRGFGRDATASTLRATTRPLQALVAGLAPHVIDDGPRLVVRGVKREHDSESDGSADHQIAIVSPVAAAPLTVLECGVARPRDGGPD
ncbi:MAG: hypothetical protein R3A78_13410 [Polyangiales bacterium]